MLSQYCSSGADPGFSNGGGGKDYEHGTSAKGEVLYDKTTSDFTANIAFGVIPPQNTTGVQGRLRSMKALGVLDALSCCLSLILKHSDSIKSSEVGFSVFPPPPPDPPLFIVYKYP